MARPDIDARQLSLVEDRVTALEITAAALEEEVQFKAGQLEGLAAELLAAENSRNTLRDELARLSSEIASTKDKIETEQKELSTEKDLLTKSIEELTRKEDLLREAEKKNETIEAEFLVSKRDFEAEKLELVAKQTELSAKLENLGREKSELSAARQAFEDKKLAFTNERQAFEAEKLAFAAERKENLAAQELEKKQLSEKKQALRYEKEQLDALAAELERLTPFIEKAKALAREEAAKAEAAAKKEAEDKQKRDEEAAKRKAAKEQSLEQKKLNEAAKLAKQKAAQKEAEEAQLLDEASAAPTAAASVEAQLLPPPAEAATTTALSPSISAAGVVTLGTALGSAKGIGRATSSSSLTHEREADKTSAATSITAAGVGAPLLTTPAEASTTTALSPSISAAGVAKLGSAKERRVTLSISLAPKKEADKTSAATPTTAAGVGAPLLTTPAEAATTTALSPSISAADVAKLGEAIGRRVDFSNSLSPEIDEDIVEISFQDFKKLLKSQEAKDLEIRNDRIPIIIGIAKSRGADLVNRNLAEEGEAEEMPISVALSLCRANPKDASSFELFKILIRNGAEIGSSVKIATKLMVGNCLEYLIISGANIFPALQLIHSIEDVAEKIATKTFLNKVLTIIFQNQEIPLSKRNRIQEILRSKIEEGILALALPDEGSSLFWQDCKDVVTTPLVKASAGGASGAGAGSATVSAAATDSSDLISQYAISFKMLITGKNREKVFVATRFLNKCKTQRLDIETTLDLENTANSLETPKDRTAPQFQPHPTIDFFPQII